MADEDDPEIGTNEHWRGLLVRARKDHGLTQQQLGDKVGVSQVMISKIESGESSSSKLVIPICRLLSIPPPAYFLDDWQQRWYELGHVLRFRDPDQADAAIRLVESMTKRLDVAAPEPDPKPGDRK